MGHGRERRCSLQHLIRDSDSIGLASIDRFLRLQMTPAARSQIQRSIQPPSAPTKRPQCCVTGLHETALPAARSGSRSKALQINPPICNLGTKRPAGNRFRPLRALAEPQHTRPPAGLSGSWGSRLLEPSRLRY